MHGLVKMHYKTPHYNYGEGKDGTFFKLDTVLSSFHFFAPAEALVEEAVWGVAAPFSVILAAVPGVLMLGSRLLLGDPLLFTSDSSLSFLTRPTLELPEGEGGEPAGLFLGDACFVPLGLASLVTPMFLLGSGVFGGLPTLDAVGDSGPADLQSLVVDLEWLSPDCLALASPAAPTAFLRTEEGSRPLDVGLWGKAGGISLCFSSVFLIESSMSSNLLRGTVGAMFALLVI
jgi:hypothetical protein